MPLFMFAYWSPAVHVRYAYMMFVYWPPTVHVRCAYMTGDIKNTITVSTV